jgi:hypothetical protein
MEEKTELLRKKEPIKSGKKIPGKLFRGHSLKSVTCEAPSLTRA